MDLKLAIDFVLEDPESKTYQDLSQNALDDESIKGKIIYSPVTKGYHDSEGTLIILKMIN